MKKQLISASFFTEVADAIFTLAIMWVINERLNSAFVLSLIYASTSMMSIVVGPIAGVWVDRWQPLKVARVVSLLMALVGGAVILVNRLQAELLPYFLVGIVFVNNFVQTFYSPSKAKIVRRSYSDKQALIEVNGYLSSASQVGMMLGKALAGMTLIQIALDGTMVLQSFFFLIVYVIYSTMKLTNQTTDAQQEEAQVTSHHFWQEFKEGVNVLKESRALLSFTLFNLVLNACSIGFLYMTLFTRHYQFTAVQYGIFEIVGTIATASAGLFIGRLLKLLPLHKMMFIGLFVASLGTIALGLQTNVYVAYIIFAIQCLAMITVHVIYGSLISCLVPERYLARVQGLLVAFSTMAIPLASLILGYISDKVEVRYIFVGVGLTTLLLSFVPLVNKNMRNTSL